MYVTSRKTNRGRIIRYRMDGKNETVLVASGLSRPNGLAIDFKSELPFCYIKASSRHFNIFSVVLNFLVQMYCFILQRRDIVYV